MSKLNAHVPRPRVTYYSEAITLSSACTDGCPGESELNCCRGREKLMLGLQMGPLIIWRQARNTFLPLILTLADFAVI